MSSLPEIIYQDDCFLALNKPPGLHSVKNPNNKNSSLAAILEEQIPKSSEIGTPGIDFGLVQRLDFETSGIILVAKSQQVWNKLHSRILAGEVKKKYLCILEGDPIAAQAATTLTAYIGSEYRRSKKVKVVQKPPKDSNRFLSSTSHFQYLEYSPLSDSTLTKIQADSARRHQVRAHSSYLGFPLLGDKLYGSKKELYFKYPVGFFLHAHEICFKHPKSGQEVHLIAKIPEDSARLISL